MGHLTLKYVPSSSKCGGQKNSPERSCSLQLQHDICSELTKEMPASSSFPWYPPKQTDMQVNVLAKSVLAVPRKCHSALKRFPSAYRHAVGSEKERIMEVDKWLFKIVIF